MNLLALVGAPHLAPVVQAAAEAGPGLQINFFWVIVSSLNFILFLALANLLFGRTISNMLKSRRDRIAQGLRDAEQARQDLANAEAERVETLAEARREARELLERAQRVAQETRDADIAATKAELDRIRERAAADIEAEKVRAMVELRAEVADLALAAAAKVIGASMTGATQRRLVEDFISESASASSPPGTAKPN